MGRMILVPLLCEQCKRQNSFLLSNVLPRSTSLSHSALLAEQWHTGQFFLDVCQIGPMIRPIPADS